MTDTTTNTGAACLSDEQKAALMQAADVMGANGFHWVEETLRGLLEELRTRSVFDVALDALAEYQANWDTGLAQPYAESERIAMECAVEAVREALNEARAAIAAGGAQEAVAWRGAPLSLIPNLVDSNKVAVNVALLEMGDAMSTWRTESEKYGEITSRAQSAFCDGYEAGIAAILCALAEHAAPLPREAATGDREFHEAAVKLVRDMMNLIPSFSAPSDILARINALVTAPLPREAATVALTDAARDVLAERKRQVTVEGFTPERDDAYQLRDLAHAAGSYAISGRNVNLYPNGQPPATWPWPSSWWKPESERRSLVKAGALILAEIERIDRTAPAAAANGEQ